MQTQADLHWGVSSYWRADGDSFAGNGFHIISCFKFPHAQLEPCDYFPHATLADSVRMLIAGDPSKRGAMVDVAAPRAFFIHSLWVENPVALARLFQLLKLALDKPYKTE